MHLHHIKFQRQNGTRGSALIVSLFLIVITTLILVGYTTTSRNEVSNASAFLASQQSQLYVDMATNHARALINAAIDDSNAPTGTRLRLATAPGKIIRLKDGETSEKDYPTALPALSASVSTNTNIGFNTAGLLSGLGNLVPSSNEPLPVTWLYVRRNGVIETADQGLLYDEDNPLVGRYAFYTDDESARININIAHTRDSSAKSTSSTSRIELAGIPDVTANDITSIGNQRNQNKLFPTLYAAFTVIPADTEGGKLAEAMLTEPESFTHYNHSSTLSMLATEKFALTTRVSSAGGLRFLDILNDPDSDPGNLSSIDNSKLNTVFTDLYQLFDNKDWPIVNGKSFVDKYGENGSAQIILNIIDYVRSLESQNDRIEPLHGTFQNGAFTWSGGSMIPASLTSSTLVGNSRRPLVTGVGVEIPKDEENEEEGNDESAKVYKVRVWVKVYNPSTHQTTPGEVGTNPSNLDIELLRLTTELTVNGQTHSQPLDIAEANLRGDEVAPEVASGTARIVEQIFILPPNAFAESPSTASDIEFKVRVSLSEQAGGAVYDVVPLANAEAITISVKPGQTIATEPQQSASTDDPYVNRREDDWSASTAPFITGITALNGATSRTTLGGTNSKTPQQDTNSDDTITNIGVGMPKKNGLVTTPGVLGFIHTGIIDKTLGNSAPWRTIRLQPQKQTGGASSALLPDWALVDLFASASDSSGPQNPEMTSTKPNARAGMINLNTTLTPFLKAPTRTLPLRALLHGVTSLPTSDLDTLVDNITEKTLATNGYRYTTQQEENETPVYYHPGEILEVLGIADKGEESEVVAREILPLISTRSNVFRVYAIGQAIQQTESRINIGSEKRTISLVEVEDTVPGKARTKVVYQQNWKQ